MSKAIKTVKSKNQLKRLLESTAGTGRELLEQWMKYHKLMPNKELEDKLQQHR
tara:strand:+ start:356 stop:514 length:159 start_codon:yes stop_codon:yes gene_type:complete